MQSGRRWRLPSTRLLRATAPWLLVFAGLLGVRLSKGAFLADAYALLSRPFWPGTAQREWLQSAQQLDQQARLASLERDNRRLRQLLELQQQSGADVTAAVISRELGGGGSSCCWAAALCRASPRGIRCWRRGG